MKATWQLQHAKNQFSTLVDKAIKEGAQTITRHGEPAVVILGIKDYQKLKPQKRFSKLFRKFRGLDLKIERSREMGRRIDL
ncbi:MAG: type II toxin-antitoxin system Phd/YefM family antitoxin [Verrucomicrobiota bacterium]